ncbi:MAG: hypothetical protein SF002_10955 [Alphaproteobacteria bacterium]|nr:hypothetical protein [Alphaproteobacteria bacterium]
MLIPPGWSEIDRIHAQTLAGPAPTLAVTAASRGDGVTSLALALARRSAATGRRTLLVDLAWHAPAVAARTGLVPSAWGADAVADASTVPAVWWSNHDFGVLAHSTDPAALGLRDPAMLRRALAAWQQVAERVVIDCSPVLTRNAANMPAEAVAAAAAGTILVVKAGTTRTVALEQAVARLTDRGASLLGIVYDDRECPLLAAELERETRRLDRVLPHPMAWLRRVIRASTLLRQEV